MADNKPAQPAVNVDPALEKVKADAAANFVAAPSQEGSN